VELLITLIRLSLAAPGNIVDKDTPAIDMRGGLPVGLKDALVIDPIATTEEGYLKAVFYRWGKTKMERRQGKIMGCQTGHQKFIGLFVTIFHKSFHRKIVVDLQRPRY
jgi:hypothetical protein